MNQTNGMPAEMPTLAAMLEAVQEIERENYQPPTEYRVHPDDWDELRLELQPHMVKFSPGRPDQVFGLNIVIDSKAPRLPRKAPNSNSTTP